MTALPVRRAIVREPSSRLADGLVTHIESEPVDVELARRQWSDYVVALESAGWEIIRLPPLDDHPDGVFVEDAAVVFGDLAVITRPGAASRRGETRSLAATFAALGFEIAEIEEPATLDGGDVLKVATTVYVGRSGRTDGVGIEQLRSIIESRGAVVVDVPVTEALHLKSCVTSLPDGTIVGHEPLVDDPALFPGIRFSEEESGAHVVDLGDRRILLADSCPRTATAYGELGYEVMTVGVSEFEKLEGCVTCLSIRLHDGID